MKKRISVCLALVLLCTLASPVLADVIWMPYGDTFFENHMADCEYVRESYEAKQDAPYYRSPEEADKALGTVPAGTVVGIEYLWNHGEWGTGYNSEISSAVNDGGWWVRLADFRKLYGADDFEAEHRGELVSENGVFRPEAGSTVCFWSFPGAASCSSMPIGDDDAGIDYDKVYTDGEGRKWGRVTYYFGFRDCWICTSDPSNPNLPATAPRYADHGEPDESAEPGSAAEPAVSKDEPQAKQGVPTTSVILIVCLVGLLVIAASIVLVVLLARSRKAGKP